MESTLVSVLIVVIVVAVFVVSFDVDTDCSAVVVVFVLVGFISVVDFVVETSFDVLDFVKAVPEVDLVDLVFVEVPIAKVVFVVVCIVCVVIAVVFCVAVLIWDVSVTIDEDIVVLAVVTILLVAGDFDDRTSELVLDAEFMSVLELVEITSPCVDLLFVAVVAVVV